MMKKKPPLSSLSEEELQVRLRKIIMSGLGKSWMFWPARAEVRRRCAISGRSGWFRCERNPAHEVEKIDVDHVSPCVKPSDGWKGWDVYINSRFVLANKLQGLCRACHKEKSKEENAERRRMKKCAKSVKKNEIG